MSQALGRLIVAPTQRVARILCVVWEYVARGRILSVGAGMPARPVLFLCPKYEKRPFFDAKSVSCCTFGGLSGPLAAAIIETNRSIILNPKTI